jgi:hypothetical protein
MISHLPPQNGNAQFILKETRLFELEEGEETKMLRVWNLKYGKEAFSTLLKPLKCKSK